MCGDTIYGRIEHGILIKNSTLSLGYVQKQPLNWTFIFNNMYEFNMYKHSVLKEL